MRNQRTRLCAGLLIAGVLLIDPAPAWAYLDPNTQVQIVNMLWPILGMIGAFLAAMLWPFALLLRWLKSRFSRGAAWCALIGTPVLIAAAAAATWLYVAGGDKPLEVPKVFAVANNPSFERIVVLGMDGLDPNVMDELMDQGLLPNFDRLRKGGTYRRLQTTTPPARCARREARGASHPRASSPSNCTD